MDPLGKVNEASRMGKLPPDIIEKIFSRMPELASMVSNVEAAAKLTYPPYYVQPVMILVKSQAEVGATGVYYARNVPAVLNNKLNLLIEFTAPLLLYSSKQTLQAVVAHEFTHYLELVRRFATSPFSSPSPSTMFEATYKDMQEAVPPELIFGRRKGLVSAIDKKFSEGFSDEPMNRRAIKNWLDRKLPYVVVSPDDNAVKVPATAVMNANLDVAVVERVAKLGRRTF